MLKTAPLTEEQKQVAYTAQKTLEANVEQLAVELPGITMGYIGNFESWGDDRYFHIFLPHPGRVGTFGDSVRLGDFTQLPQAAAKWDALADSARKLYHNGSYRG